MASNEQVIIDLGKPTNPKDGTTVIVKETLDSKVEIGIDLDSQVDYKQGTVVGIKDTDNPKTI